MSDVASFIAKRALLDLATNGGRLQRQPDEAIGLACVHLDFDGGADRSRCRAILAEIKADGSVWAAALRLLSTEGAAS